MTSETTSNANNGIVPAVKRSLSTQLLMLTIVVVLVTEIVIMIPSLAHQQENWLRMRVEAAYLIGVALEDEHAHEEEAYMIRKVFAQTHIYGVMLREAPPGEYVVASGAAQPEAANIDQVDLARYGLLTKIRDAWTSIAGGGHDLIEVSGGPYLVNSNVSRVIVVRDNLRHDLRIYARNILALSLLISGITALFVFLSLNNLIIKPVRNMRENMAVFELDPENPDNILKPSNRLDEIGETERDLSTLENRLQSFLSERRRLAALGAGISKISHDLRNILASAQLMSDRLVKSDDPRVKKLSPRLVDALDRAITLSRETLNYGKISPEILTRENVTLANLVDDVFDDTASMHVTMINNVPETLRINIDRTQFHRALTNIIRNAVEALSPDEDEDVTADEYVPPEGKKPSITVEAQIVDNQVLVDVADNGPGLPEGAKKFLYEPFKGSYKPGGSGLGVAITAEIMRAHRGTLTLYKSDDDGATFRLTLPEYA